MSEIADFIAGQKVIAILRNMSVADSVRLARKAWDLGIDLVEVPIQTDDARASLEAVLDAARDAGRPIAAGTVTTVEQVEYCARVGVAFTVAPGFDPEVVAASQRLGLPHIPGVSTPTEIQAAVKAGCHVLKAFPATVLGTEWFKTMRGPFPRVQFMVTGGIDSRNAADYLAAGAVMVGVGSALDDPSQLDALAALARN